MPPTCARDKEACTTTTVLTKRMSLRNGGWIPAGGARVIYGASTARLVAISAQRRLDSSGGSSRDLRCIYSTSSCHDSVISQHMTWQYGAFRCKGLSLVASLPTAPLDDRK